MEGTLQTVSELTTQTPFYIEHLDAIVTMLVTIIGFVVTYLMTKKNFKDEVKKNKIALASDQIQTLPYDICQLMDAMIKGNQQGEILNQYSSILSKVLAYGSSHAIKIAIKMQQMSYVSTSNASIDERLPMLAAYSLLITQLKYDLTSEIISPESWFQLRMNDYEKIQPQMQKSINDLIKELDLNHAFTV